MGRRSTRKGDFQLQTGSRHGSRTLPVQRVFTDSSGKRPYDVPGHQGTLSGSQSGRAAAPTPKPTMSNQHDVTAKLAALSGGAPEVWDELMPIVYQQLKQLAHRHLRNERTGHTLGTTGLVHEAYLKLVDVDRVDWHDRTHFFAMASRAMRRILIDYARTRNRQKRGSGLAHVPLNDAFQVAEAKPGDLLGLDEALTRLEAVNQRQCRVVEYRFFGGMSVKETAEALEVSVSSVKRDWAICRAWLNQELSE